MLIFISICTLTFEPLQIFAKGYLVDITSKNASLLDKSVCKNIHNKAYIFNRSKNDF